MYFKLTDNLTDRLFGASLASLAGIFTMVAPSFGEMGDLSFSAVASLFDDILVCAALGAGAAGFLTVSWFGNAGWLGHLQAFASAVFTTILGAFIAICILSVADGRFLFDMFLVAPMLALGMIWISFNAKVLWFVCFTSLHGCLILRRYMKSRANGFVIGALHHGPRENAQSFDRAFISN